MSPNASIWSVEGSGVDVGVVVDDDVPLASRPRHPSHVRWLDDRSKSSILPEREEKEDRRLVTDGALCKSNPPKSRVTTAPSFEWPESVSDHAGAVAHRMPTRTRAAIRAFIVWFSVTGTLGNMATAPRGSMVLKKDRRTRREAPSEEPCSELQESL